MRSPHLAKSRRGRALVLALVPAFALVLTAALAPPAAGQRLAYDEGDGHTAAGFADGAAAHGGWAGAVTSDGAALVATVGNHWRTLTTPANAGVVWYAVTLRMRDPLTGYASVVPAPGPGGQYSELGFSPHGGTGGVSL